MVESAYRPRDPRGKLREVTGRWVAAMGVAGQEPNCGVVFDEDCAESTPHTYGYLVDDRRPESFGKRYLVLQDGDVLRPPETWLGEPNDHLITLLPKALANARLGGTGWLIREGDDGAVVHRVPDRRRSHEPRHGPERRGS